MDEESYEGTRIELEDEDWNHSEELLAFAAETFCDLKTSMKCLEKFGWNVIKAIEDYKDHPPPKNDCKCEFARFIDKDLKKVTPQGVADFCEAIGISPLDPEILIFCYQCDAKVMGEFTVKEFYKGVIVNLKMAPKLKHYHKVVLKWRRILAEPSVLRPRYRWMFKYFLEGPMKVLPGELALDYWRILFRSCKFPFFEEFMKFAEQRLYIQERRSVSKDLWNMVFDFLHTVKPDTIMTENLEESAWPTMIDDFIVEMQEKNRSTDAGTDKVEDTNKISDINNAIAKAETQA